MRRTLLLIAMLGLVLSACGGSLEATGNVQQGPATGNAVQIEMTDNVFEPGTIRAEPGEQITLEISNAGRTVHNLVMPDLEVNSGLIQADEVVTASFEMPDEEVEFICTLHRGMEGRLVPERS